jgi:rubrerythrin
MTWCSVIDMDGNVTEGVGVEIKTNSASHAWIKCNNCSDYNATFYDTEEYDECPVCKKERDKIEIEFLSDEDMKL